jgi:hypothetical protein
MCSREWQQQRWVGAADAVWCQLLQNPPSNVAAGQASVVQTHAANAATANILPARQGVHAIIIRACAELARKRTF